MTILLAILLTLTALPVGPEPEPAPMPVDIIFVSTPEGAFTEERKAELRADVVGAFQFWYDRAPDPIAFELRAERDLFVPDVHTVIWFKGLLTFANPAAEIYIVYNDVTGTPIAGLWGEAYYYYRAAIVVSRYHGDQTMALITHELGHALYNLPDRSMPCPADIMCAPIPAVRLGTLGCATLADLGRPCYRVSLPMVHAP